MKNLGLKNLLTVLVGHILMLFLAGVLLFGVLGFLTGRWSQFDNYFALIAFTIWIVAPIVGAVFLSRYWQYHTDHFILGQEADKSEKEEDVSP